MPEQDALARKADDTRAGAALQKGVSFTPPMAPSVGVAPPPPQVEQAACRDPCAIVHSQAGRDKTKIAEQTLGGGIPARAT